MLVSTPSLVLVSSYTAGFRDRGWWLFAEWAVLRIWASERFFFLFFCLVSEDRSEEPG